MSEFSLSLKIRMVCSASLAKKAKYFISAYNCLWRVMKSHFYLAYKLTEIPQGHCWHMLNKMLCATALKPSWSLSWATVCPILPHNKELSTGSPFLRMGMLTTTQNWYSAAWASLPLLSKREHSTQNHPPFTTHLRINLFLKILSTDLKLYTTTFVCEKT